MAAPNLFGTLAFDATFLDCAGDGDFDSRVSGEMNKLRRPFVLVTPNAPMSGAEVRSTKASAPLAG